MTMEYKNEYSSTYHSVNINVAIKAPEMDNDKVKEYIRKLEEITSEFFFKLPDGLVPVYLENNGPNRINVIKVIREYTKCGLKEAKDFTEMPFPVELHSGMPRSEAVTFKNALQNAGAVAFAGPKKFSVMR